MAGYVFRGSRTGSPEPLGSVLGSQTPGRGFSPRGEAGRGGRCPQSPVLKRPASSSDLCSHPRHTSPLPAGAQDKLFPISLTSRRRPGPSRAEPSRQEAKGAGQVPTGDRKGPRRDTAPAGTPPQDPLHPEATRRGRGSQPAGSSALSPGPARSLPEFAPRLGRFVRGSREQEPKVPRDGDRVLPSPDLTQPWGCKETGGLRRRGFKIL